jgi:hypothetical protein
VRVLFIVKIRESGYIDGENCGWGDYSGGTASGLGTSAQLVSDMLNTIGIESKMVKVIDNNDIDREVYNYKPDYVIIEALWVVPEKFPLLHKLHPRVRWIVRLHSEVPFLANEGIAMDWINRYNELGFVGIGVNNCRLGEALKVLRINPIYLPNFYPVPDNGWKSRKNHGRLLDVGCFGAIRPLKNQLIQAFAAIKYADERGKHLRFHINSERIEQKGGQVLKNLRALFDNVSHELIEHPWMSRDDLLDFLPNLDVGINVSYSETYSIMTADYVVSNVPIVVSPEIYWAPSGTKVDPNDLDDIADGIGRALRFRKLNFLDRYFLRMNSNAAKKVWSRLLK